MNNKILIRNAILAAVYAVLTITLAPLSFSFLQVRISEGLHLLAFYDKRYIPGLIIGVFLANINSPLGITDAFIGTLASVLALLCMQYCKSIYTASLMPVIFNGIIIGTMQYVLGLVPVGMLLVMSMLYVAAGEFIAVSVIGVIVMKAGLAKRFGKL